MEDLPDLVEFANNEDISRNLTDAFPFPYTEENGRRFIEFARSTKDLIYAIDKDGLAIGGVGIHPKTNVYRFTAEVGYWLAQPFWRQGIMRKALGLLINIAFTQTELQRLEASVYDYNTASQALLKSLGFSLEGIRKEYTFKNGAFHDSYLFRMVKEEAEELGYLSEQPGS